MFVYYILLSLFESYITPRFNLSTLLFSPAFRTLVGPQPIIQHNYSNERFDSSQVTDRLSLQDDFRFLPNRGVVAKRVPISLRMTHGQFSSR